ncbi:MAG: DegT/DnrJ/EryC1/StrS family aminotransferase [Desulfobacula sp.]|nr:DegT/DnrJ/EryC1/StrS family aminotransferase [Desulfobacula sp.]
MADNMKLFLELGAKTRGFIKGMSDSKGAVGKFVSGAKRELASLRKMSTSIHGKLAAMGLSIGAGKILLDSARLDKSLVRITQTAEVGKDRAAGLRKEFFRMGRESGQVIENLRDGFNDLVQSGLGMNESRESLDGINVAMAVTGASARTLAGGMTVGARFFDFDLSKPGVALEMLDRMTVAGRLGNAELEDLSAIFGRIGNNASKAGMGFNQTLAFVEGLSLAEKNPERLATLADSTLRVFTNMRYMAMAQKATRVRFFNADGSRRLAFEVMADIKKKYDTLTTDMQKAKFIQAAFDKADLDTIKGIGTLLEGDALTQINRFNEKIGDAGGALKRDFTDATANLIDQSGMLKNDLREAADGFVQPMNETLGKWIQTLRKSKEKGGLGLDGKDMILGGAAILGGTALAARYGGKAISGLAGRFLKSGGSLAAGVAKGKALEAATGVTPVFVDIDEETYNIDSDKIAAAITDKTKAIMPVSLYGQPADMDAIQAVVDKVEGRRQKVEGNNKKALSSSFPLPPSSSKIKIIIDGAQSFGSTYKGKAEVHYCDIYTTSFFPAKPLGCFGDGGAVLTNSDELAKKIKMLRVHGQNKRYHHKYIGLGGRMDTLQCAITNVKLKHYKKDLLLRQEVAEKYTQVLGEKEEGKRKKDKESNFEIILPHIDANCTSAYAQYSVRITPSTLPCQEMPLGCNLQPSTSLRDEVQSKLKEQSIPTAIHYPMPLHLQECL